MATFPGSTGDVAWACNTSISVGDPFDPTDTPRKLLNEYRVGMPKRSPDGTQIAYQVGRLVRALHGSRAGPAQVYGPLRGKLVLGTTAGGKAVLKLNGRPPKRRRR